MNIRKTINDLANDESKHRKKANSLWAKSYNVNISSKRAQSLRRKAKGEYCKADSIRTAQGNLPNITSKTSFTIASNNKISNSKKLTINPKTKWKSNSKNYY